MRKSIGIDRIETQRLPRAKNQARRGVLEWLRQFLGRQFHVRRSTYNLYFVDSRIVSGDGYAIVGSQMADASRNQGNEVTNIGTGTQDICHSDQQCLLRQFALRNIPGYHQETRDSPT